MHKMFQKSYKYKCCRVSPSGWGDAFEKVYKIELKIIETTKKMFEWINSSIKNYIISVVDQEFFAADDDKLKIQKLNDNAIIPVKGSKLAAGYDLYSIDAVTIPPLSRVLVNIGLSITTPEGTYGRIAPRSGMALNGIDVGGGVIDQDYTGPLKVILINNNDDDFKVVEGMKVAQLVCEKICYPEIQIVDKLKPTERGSNGFGSTGSVLPAWAGSHLQTKFTDTLKPKPVEEKFVLDVLKPRLEEKSKEKLEEKSLSVDDLNPQTPKPVEIKKDK